MRADVSIVEQNVSLRPIFNGCSVLAGADVERSAMAFRANNLIHNKIIPMYVCCAEKMS